MSLSKIFMTSTQFGKQSIMTKLSGNILKVVTYAYPWVFGAIFVVFDIPRCIRAMKGGLYVMKRSRKR